METILITGAAGFIGSHLADALLESGHRVIGVDNFSLGSRKNIEKALSHPHFQIHEADISEEAFPASFDPGCQVDWVWHLAANSDIPAGVNNPEVDFKDTFLTTFRLLNWMRRHHVSRISFASTSAVYGDRSEPITEDSGPMLPISNYGAMKLAGEACISAAVEAWLERAEIFRFPNVVGSRATHGAIFDFIRRLRSNPCQLDVLGNGTQSKPYLHVGDLLDAMLFITNHAQARLNYFNIGPTDSITVREMAQAVVDHVSPGAALLFGEGNKGWVGDVPKFLYSTEKLASLGFARAFSSKAAVQKAIEEIALENP